MLAETRRPLVDEYDLFMLDLDGVVYIGGEAVPGVADHLLRVREAGVRVAFITNNASRTPDAVAERLQGMGVRAAPGDVVTSAQAAASLLRSEHEPGTRVLALGGRGLVEALRTVGLVPVTQLDHGDVAVLVTGYGPDVLWRDIMRAAVAVRDGLPWVASNTDLTIPTEYGQAPGHGVLVRTISQFAGVEPRVAGKPAAPLFSETIERVGGRRPLMVGDRLDTDIAGANRAGFSSLLVLTGVTGLAELVAARPEERPTFVSATLEGAFEPHGSPRGRDGDFVLSGWTGRVGRDQELEVEGHGSVGDWWRVALSAAWAHLDGPEGGSGPVRIDGLRPPEGPVGPDR